MNYFYILYSHKDHEYYYGSTTDLKNRFKQHSEGKVDSTSHRRPLKLVYYEAYVSIKQARLREKQVKNSGSTRTTLIKRIMHP